MHKSNEVNDTRKELYENFQKTRGAIMAFCRHKGITDEWLRQVFKGEYEDLDLLIEAAEWLRNFKSQKAAERERKHEMLRERVTALALT